MVAVTTNDPATPAQLPTKSTDPTPALVASPTSSHSSPTRLSLPILSDITTSQNLHGLKHSDYLRYRRYCTRRLSRIRSATSSSNSHPSNRSRYRPLTLTATHVLENPRALLIPLVQSQRAWAYAMDVKREQPSGPNRARHVVLAKLNRAVHFAEQLVMLCEHAADEHTLWEAQAYHKSMHAALALEREQWNVALRDYDFVLKIYTLMVDVRGVLGAIYKQKVEEVNQAIRFCKYNMKRGGEQEEELEGMQVDGNDVLAEQIERALTEARRKKALSFGSVDWCGRKISLRDEKVREAVHMVMEEGKRFERDNANERKVDSYDKLFMAFNDSIKVVNVELSKYKEVGADDRVTELEYLHAYVMYQRLQFTEERNLLLIKTFKAKRSTKPDDFVRLYDNLIANITDILALKGVNEDANIENEAEARRKLYLAYRCFYLAQCYQAASMQSEAAALYDRVNSHASTLGGRYGTEAKSIVQESIGMKCRAIAQAFLDQSTITEGVSDMNLGQYRKRQTMIENLDSFESFAAKKGEWDGNVICEMPPVLEAVPCKPVFFNLAIDGIKFPEREEEEKAEAPKEKSVVEEKEESAKETPQQSAFASTRLGRWWSGKN